MSTAFPRAPRRRLPTALVVGGLAVATTTATRWTGPVLGLDGDGWPTRASRIALCCVVAATASIVLARVAQRRRGPERAAWILMSLGTGSWAVGGLIWIGYLVAGQPLPSPGIADLLFLAMPLAWCRAIPLIDGFEDAPTGGSTHHVRMLDLIDSALVGLAMLLVVWVLAFHTSGSGAQERGALMAMVYPVVDAVLLTLLVRAVRRSTVDRRALTLITVGAALYATGDVGYLFVSSLLSLPEPLPGLVDVAWVAGLGIVAGGAWIALAGRESSPVAVRRDTRGTFALAVAGLAAAVGLADMTRTDGAPWTVATLVAVMVLLLLRQSMTLRENRRLSAELVRRVRDLERQASHDALTALPNRQHLSARLCSLDTHDGTHDGTGSAAVLFVDIDLLKPVNDSLGHDHGDRLIRAVADRLRSRWGDDVVRFGGDEFVAIVRGAGSVDAVTTRVEELIEDVHRPVVAGEVTMHPSISVGVAFVEAGVGPEELLRRADAALYHAKAHGRRRFAVFQPSMDDAGRRQVDIAAQIRGAVEDGRFELHYQPVIELRTGRLKGAEALLRWNHPDLGLLTPDRFLEEVDALGLLGELGRRSLREATARFAELNAARTGAPVQVTVNLSAGELDERTVTTVEEALRTSGLHPSLLVVEITEDVIVDRSVRRTLRHLRRLGVGIAIDDFGTGNSSLRQLGDYPASVLKIDRSFVQGIAGRRDRVIVGSIVELAARLGLSTVAEGVETVDQADLLTRLGCEYAQGWLFERAVPFDVLLERWLDEDAAVERVKSLLGSDQDRGTPQRRSSDADAPSMTRSSSSATVGSSSILPTT